MTQGQPRAVAVNLVELLAGSPRRAEALNKHGAALRRLGRLEEALAAYDEALAIEADCVEALNNRGIALWHLRRLEEALASYDRALALRPEYAAAWNNRGYALHSLGRLDEALASYDRALAIRPDYADAWSNRGYTLYHLASGCVEEALANYDRALAIKPDCVEALNNRGNALRELGRVEEALASYSAAIAIKPDYANAHWNEALTRLSAGDFARGWEKYEWRWRLDQLRDHQRDFHAPLWVGRQELSGKTILLHAEQGFGDTLQFCRYAPAIAAMGASVVLEVQAPLKSLLRSLPGVEQVVGQGEPLPPLDFHCPLMSLPLAFGTELGTIPAHSPYLRANPFHTAARRERLAKFDGAKIGLVWAGSAWAHIPAASWMDRRRSMRLQQMRELGTIDHITLVSLQKGEPAGQAQDPPEGMALVDWTEELRGFADTAALVEALDLVITVDTSVAHLAGALGKPVWVLNRHDRCWRWLRDREDTPWYPSMRLFTQPSPSDWGTVIRRVAAELRIFAARIRG
jgi:tetratricopeptide (TPR) repeat protein